MRCILHIGTEKTGTTTLQDWLYANRELLSEQGIYLCESTGTPNNRLLAAYCQPGFDDFFRARGIGDAEAKAEFFADFEASLAEELTAAAETHDTLLLTSEHFSSRLKDADSVARLRRLLEPHVDSFTVVCYLREQSELIRSLYTTALIDGEIMAIEAYHREPAVDEVFFNYELMLGLWASVFGAQALSVGLFGRDTLVGGDVRHDFLARVLPQLEGVELDHEVSERNQSIGRLQAILLRLVNSYMNRSSPENIDDDLRRRLAERIVSHRHLSSGRLRLPDPQRIFERFRESNARVFERYFPGQEVAFAAPEVGADPDFLLEGRFEEDYLELLVSLFEDIRVETPVEPTLRLDNDAVEFFRDLAFKYERGETLSRKEAVRLMKFARRGRPDGFYINRFLDQHAHPDDPDSTELPAA
ncbi:MAG: hypothetical protein V2I82_06455 [Halieaceae bacterium]|nr:hypothetical protein [Halieaceae bacterium]